jgi:hypothetical protein
MLRRTSVHVACIGNQPEPWHNLSMPKKQYAGTNEIESAAATKHQVGTLSEPEKWIRAVGYVQAAPGFHDNPLVVNGFSDLIVELWGEDGRHARSAPGQGPSPSNVPIMVDAIVVID